jgi:hypothetical protein
MTPEDFFNPWEIKVSSWIEWQEKLEMILVLLKKSEHIVWRGVSSASHPLHSSLYRRLKKNNHGTPPLEKEMVSFEKSLIQKARHEWRFDNLSTLEILAQIQHYGGPTRFLDVSFDPLIALWFSVKQRHDENGSLIEDSDGRIFVFDATDRLINPDDWWSRDIPWEYAPPDEWNKTLPKIWRPPSFNERIPAQNSAFLIGGVPMVKSGTNSQYRKAPGDGTHAGAWKINEVREATSVTLSMNAAGKTVSKNSRPTFTIRIEAAAKNEIRQRLEKFRGLNVASVFPDLYGLAANGANLV